MGELDRDTHQWREKYEVGQWRAGGTSKYDTLLGNPNDKYNSAL
jgi:hypothetical protein